MEQSVKQRIADIQRGNVPAGYQKTKLGITPADWSTPELNSVLTENKERNRSGRFGKEDVLSVSGEFGVTNQIELLGRSFAGASVKDYHVVEAGNIVYTKSPLKDNPYGIIKLNKGNAGIVSTLYAVYSCKSNEVGTYLDYYFSLDQNVNNYLRPLVRKGTKNDMKINNEDVLKGCVILPPESEIAKIVEILGCCDRVITLKKELIAEKKKQKKALMQKLLNPDSGFRLPGFSGKWKKFRISEICKIESGGTPATADEQCWNGDIFWCTPSDITNAGKYISHTSQKITQNGIDISSATLLPTGSVIMCSRASIGPRCITKVPMATNQGFKNFICSDLLYNEFWYYFIDTILEDLYKMASGNTFKEVSKNSIATYLVTIPSNIAEQQAIADILSAADKEIDLLEQELAQQEQKKKSLMQLLLTGIVRV